MFVIAFGILEASKIFGEGKGGLNALIALLMAFLANLSSRFIAIMEFIAPWFIFVLIVLFFIGFFLKFIGEDKGFGILKEPPVMWIVIIILGIIVLVGFMRTRGIGAAAQEVAKPFIDPAIGGIVVMLLVIFFAVVFLVAQPPKS